MVSSAASLFLARSVSFWLLKALFWGHSGDPAAGLCVCCRLGLTCLWGTAPQGLTLRTEGHKSALPSCCNTAVLVRVVAVLGEFLSFPGDRLY